MKHSSTLLAAVTLALSACSSEDKGASVGAQTATPVAAVCPDFDGVYSKKDSQNKVELYKKVEAGVVKYSFAQDSEFRPADGQDIAISVEGKSGVLRVSCDENSVSVFAQEEDDLGEKQEAVTKRYEAIDPKTMKVTMSGDLAFMNGEYTKE